MKRKNQKNVHLEWPCSLGGVRSISFLIELLLSSLLLFQPTCDKTIIRVFAGSCILMRSGQQLHQFNYIRTTENAPPNARNSTSHCFLFMHLESNETIGLHRVKLIFCFQSMFFSYFSSTLNFSKSALIICHFKFFNKKNPFFFFRVIKLRNGCTCAVVQIFKYSTFGSFLKSTNHDWQEIEFVYSNYKNIDLFENAEIPKNFNIKCKKK